MAACDRAPATGDEWRIATEADRGARPCARPPAKPPQPADILIVIDQPSEFPCEIVELPVSVTLRAESDSLPDPSSSAVMTSAGRFITTTRSGQVLWWDRDGSYLGAFGSTGEGPGEFTTMGEHLLYIGPADSLYVVDGRNRWSVFDQEMNYIRSFIGLHSGRWRASTSVTDDGSILTTSRVIADDPGNIFHLMDLDGELIRSFGGPPRAPGVDQMVYVNQVSAYGGGETFWVAPVNEAATGMQLEEWTLDGRRLRTIKRNAPWLPSDGFPPSNDGIDLPSYLFLSLDDEGLLWVAVGVPDVAWKESIVQERPEEGQPFAEPTPEFFRQRFDEWVEVIDPDAGQVLASSRIDLPTGPGSPFAGNFRGTRKFYRVESDAIGFNTIEVFEAALLAKDR